MYTFVYLTNSTYPLNNFHMKRYFAFVVILLFTYTQSFSQFKSSDLSLTLGYPIPVGNNFVNKGGNGYTGIIDFGLDYTIFKANRLDVGILMNTSFLHFKATDVALNILSPKIKVGYTIQLKIVDIQPQIAIGYSHFSFKGPAVFNGSVYNESARGISAKASTKVILKSEKKVNYYVSLAYEFNKLGELTTEAANTDFNRHIQFISPGVGILWKFGLN
jgi:hypothetical protein